MRSQISTIRSTLPKHGNGFGDDWGINALGEYQHNDFYDRTGLRLGVFKEFLIMPTSMLPSELEKAAPHR